MQGRKIVINHTILLEALDFDSSMLNLPKINHYVSPLDTSVINCLNFKCDISSVLDHFVPAFLFDVPVNINCG